MRQDPKRLHLAFPAAALAASLAAASSGCGGPEARPGGVPRPALLSTAVGPALSALWNATGGVQAWRRVEAVRFTYEAELEPAGEGRPASRIGPREVSIDVGNGRARWSAGEAPGGGPLPGKGPLSADPESCALQAVRVFFCFPFALLDPVWEFQRDLIAGEPVNPLDGFWVLPLEAGAPHRAYYVDLDPASGLPRAVYYQPEGPCFGGRILKAVFGEYREVKGIRIPTEITHVSCGRRGEAEARYPWEEGPGARPQDPSGRGEGWVLRERIGAIELLEREAPAGTSVGGESSP